MSRSLTLVILGFALIAGGCDRQSEQKAQPQAVIKPGAQSEKGAPDYSHKGSLMPDMALSDAAGGQRQLSSLRGKPVLVNLWATWCRPCITELPMLNTIADEGKLRVLAVSQDSGEPAKVAAFLKERGLTALDLWLDPENDLSFHFGDGSGTLPTTVLYDAAGREVWRVVGERDWTSAESRTLLGV